METHEIKTTIEQVRNSLEVIQVRLAAIEARLAHQQALAELRLARLEQQQSDHETRLRSSSDAVVRLTTTTSLAQAFQAGFALVLAAIAAWLGQR